MIGALRRRLHELARQVATAHASPARLGAAVLVGCIVGATPLFGLHLSICILFAWLFGLNQVVVYGAANISLPPLVPLLGFACVQSGERCLRGRWLPLSVGYMRSQPARALAKLFFVDWMVGALVVGGALGLVGGALLYVIARARKGVPSWTAIDAAMARAQARYRGLHRKYRIYAAMKYRLDPCYRAIAPHLLPRTFTVDLGTGLGMLPVLLGELGEGRRALGVEWDADKARAGQVAAQNLDGVELTEGDARTHDLPACDAITLVDVLHYYDAEAQRALLRRCEAALRPGGRLLVREGDGEKKAGARFTRAVEKLVTRLGWNRGPEVRFRPIRELEQDLAALGLTVCADAVAGKLHPGNVLLVAVKAGTAADE